MTQVIEAIATYARLISMHAAALSRFTSILFHQHNAGATIDQIRDAHLAMVEEISRNVAGKVMDNLDAQDIVSILHIVNRAYGTDFQLDVTPITPPKRPVGAPVRH